MFQNFFLQSVLVGCKTDSILHCGSRSKLIFTRLITNLILYLDSLLKLFFTVSFTRLKYKSNIVLWKPGEYFFSFSFSRLQNQFNIVSASFTRLKFKSNIVSWQPGGSLVKLFFFHSVLLGCQTDSVWFSNQVLSVSKTKKLIIFSFKIILNCQVPNLDCLRR